jgi:hypothetical protein
MQNVDPVHSLRNINGELTCVVCDPERVGAFLGQENNDIRRRAVGNIV